MSLICVRRLISVTSVYVVNYSWTHSAMWNIIRSLHNLLSTHRLSDVDPGPCCPSLFFHAYSSHPGRSCLHAFRQRLSLLASPHHLLSTELGLTLWYIADYGGTLPSLHDLEDHLSSIPPPPPIHSAIPISTMSAPSRHLSVAPQHTTLSPRSLLNPFFGYPVTASLAYNVLTLHHGRRRKRDLARTLVFLWWERWRDRVTIGMWFLLFWIAMKLWKAVRVDGRGRVLIGPV